MNATSPLDPRLHAYRPDLADSRLEGRVTAARFVAGTPARVARGQVDLRRLPAPSAGLDTQLLFDEAVAVFEEKAGWSWVQAARDGYVGYVESAGLAPGKPKPSHQVSAIRTFRFSAPDIKSPPLDHLSLGTPLEATDEHDRFLELAGGGFVYAPHAEPWGVVHADFVATAERFLAVPYLWGGKSALGLDCSALVQGALLLAGRPCPRDTYQQADDPRLGELVEADRTLHRGDLLFSPGHVAFATGSETLLHANAWHLAVAHETLASFRSRLARRGEAITRVRRPAEAAAASGASWPPAGRPA